MTVIRRRRPVLRAGVALALVAGLVAGAWYGDGRVRAWAEAEVARSVESRLQLTRTPTVMIAGTTFIPQLATRDIDRIEVLAQDVVILAEGYTIRVDELDLVLEDVTTSDYRTFVAGRLSGTARIIWSSAQEVVRIPLRDDGDGRIQADYHQSVMGQSIHLIVSAIPTVDEGAQTLQLADARATVAGYEIPDDVVQGTVDDLVKPLPISLPLGLRASGVRATQAGLELDIAGSEVQLG